MPLLTVDALIFTAPQDNESYPEEVYDTVKAFLSESGRTLRGAPNIAETLTFVFTPSLSHDEWLAWQGRF
jgi:hypothetical protein